MTIAATQKYFPSTVFEENSSLDTVKPSEVNFNLSSEREKVSDMLKDKDVRELSEKVVDEMKEFANKILNTFAVTESTRIALFGDPEEGTGTVVFLERETGKQINFTFTKSNVEAWTSGNLNKLTYTGVELRHVQELAYRFAKMR